MKKVYLLWYCARIMRVFVYVVYKRGVLQCVFLYTLYTNVVLESKLAQLTHHLLLSLPRVSSRLVKSKNLISGDRAGKQLIWPNLICLSTLIIDILDTSTQSKKF